MSETILTKGWPGPKGKCDICNNRPARYWFGDTSVALCGDYSCDKINQDQWDQMIKDMEQEKADRNDYW